MRSATLALGMAALLLVGGGAQAGEKPPSTPAQSILGSAVRGSNYQISSPVASDGLMYDFKLQTPYGQFAVQGEEFLKLRLHELAALASMEQITQSQEFTDALGKSVAKPIQTVGQTLANPFSLITGTVSGIGSVFNRVGAGLSDPYHNNDNPADGLLGFSSAQRKIAYEFNVDPYTTFPPLQQKLHDLAHAAGLGALAVKGATMAIPGAAGLAVSGVQTAGSLGDAVRDKTVAELDIANRDALLKMGIHQQVVDAFMSSSFYTPTDKTLVTAALGSLQGVGGRELFLARIATANRVDLAFFHRLQAQWLAAYHHKTAPISTFVSFEGFPMAETGDGRLVGLYPLDIVSWTDNNERVAQSLTEAMRKQGFTKGAAMHITGKMTPEAKKGFEALGWTVVENDTGLLN